jgi:acyl dehydratase
MQRALSGALALPVDLVSSLFERVGIDIDLKLLWATLLSARHRRLNRQAIGHTLEGAPETITPEMAAAFAAATDDDNPCYLGADAIVPPFLVGRLVLPLLNEVLVHPDLRLNILRMVHAQQEIRWLRPVRPGDSVRLRLTISEIQQTRAGELLTLTGEALRGDVPLGQAITGLMVRARHGAARKPRSEEQEHREELFRLTVPTSRDQALRYAEASGDRNFIHTSKLLARLAGLPGTILHGMCVLAMSYGAIVRHRLDNDPLRCAGVRARFSSPALPGQPLTVVGYDDGTRRLGFEVLNPRGKPVIKQGELSLNPV